jgi:hypothetical protein
MEKLLKESIKSEPSKNQSSIKEKFSLYEIKLLNQRLNSHSQRIHKLQDKLAQILSNHKHYLKIRLPDVLKREKARARYSAELDQARNLLKSLNKKRFTFLSNSKDEEKRRNRYIGMFTHVEMERLRRLLDIDHSHDYFLYRKENYENLKDKHVVLLNENEKRKLHHILNKKLLTKLKTLIY